LRDNIGMSTEQPKPLTVAPEFAAVSQDRDSWLAGYRAGLTRYNGKLPHDLDALSFFSGRVEGIAHMKNPPPVTLEDDAALSGKGFHWLAGAWSVAGALDLMASELPKVKPSAVVLQKTFEDDGQETFQIWSPLA
jgi:hypothetical protein